MKNKKEEFQQAQQGTGSAENTGQGRDRQINSNTELSKKEKQNIAAKMGKGPNNVGSLKDMGALSGRDDAAGGSGDRMEEESSGKATDR